MGVAAMARGQTLRGEVRVPGDKSVAHRALILAALAGGPSRVRGLPDGADVRSTAACLRRLGVAVEAEAGGAGVRVIPPRGGPRPPDGPLDAGNSGTTLRLLAGVLAGQPFSSCLTGDASLRRRPMTRVAAPLERMGATVATSDGGTAPLRVRGPVPPRPLLAIDHRTEVASAQVKSCLLLAGLHAVGRTSVAEPFPSRDHTERLLAVFGARVSAGPDGVAWVESDGAPALEAADVVIPGDFSSAAFWIVAGLLVPGSEISLPTVGVNPTRTGLLRVLERMGARVGAGMGAGAGVSLGGRRLLPGGEPVADITVRAVPGLAATVVSPAEVPGLIDEIPVLAVVATQAEGVTVIEGAGELRVKESDRLAALALELGRLGARVDAAGDRLVVEGPTPLRPAAVSAHGDHRVAMALAVAALLMPPGTVTPVDGLESAGISYPGFLSDLEALRN